MLKRKTLIFCASFFVFHSLFSQGLVWNKNKMEYIREYKSTNKDYQESVSYIIKYADSVMQKRDFPRVTRKKIDTNITKDMHNYVSYATYAWPDSSKINGLPYIFKDGKINHSLPNIDFRNLTFLNKRCKSLALAYYFTKNKKYVKRLSSYLKVWFIKEDTRMNPNFKHSQAVPGKNKGRIIGVIDGINFLGIIESIELAKSSGNLSTNEYLKIKEWFNKLLRWFNLSHIGSQGFKLKNNIGTAYQMQRIAYTSFIGDRNKLIDITRTNLVQLLDSQFDSVGKQRFELKRTKPCSYSLANLTYWYNIYKILINNNVNNNITDRIKKTIKRGFHFIESQNPKGCNSNHLARFYLLKKFSYANFDSSEIKINKDKGRLLNSFNFIVYKVTLF